MTEHTADAGPPTIETEVVNAATDVKEKLSAFRAAAIRAIQKPEAANDIGGIRMVLGELDKTAGRLPTRFSQARGQRTSDPPTAAETTTTSRPDHQPTKAAPSDPHGWLATAENLHTALNRFRDAALKQPAAAGKQIHDVTSAMKTTTAAIRRHLPQPQTHHTTSGPSSEPEPVLPRYARDLKRANQAGSVTATGPRLPEASRTALHNVTTGPDRPAGDGFTVVGPSQQPAMYQPLSAAAAASLLARFGPQVKQASAAKNPVLPDAAAEALQAATSTAAPGAGTSRQPTKQPGQRFTGPGLSRRRAQTRTGTDSRGGG